MKAIDELDALYEKATKGPWGCITPDGIINVYAYDDRGHPCAHVATVGEETAAQPDAALIVALVNAWPEVRERLRRAEVVERAATKAMETLYGLSEESSYGHPLTENPHDFDPDSECSTAEERERHRKAKEAWDRGERPDPLPTWTTWKSREEAEEYVRKCMEAGADSALIREPGADELQRWTVHCHVGGWGLGTSVLVDEELRSLATSLRAALTEEPPHDDVNCVSCAKVRATLTTEEPHQ